MFPLCVCSPQHLTSFSAYLLYVNNRLPATVSVFVKCRKALQTNNSSSAYFRLYVIFMAIYAGVQFFLSFLMRIPACHRMTNQCDRWPFIRFLKWMRQVFHFSYSPVPFCPSPSPPPKKRKSWKKILCAFSIISWDEFF